VSAGVVIVLALSACTGTDAPSSPDSGESTASHAATVPVGPSASHAATVPVGPSASPDHAPGPATGRLSDRMDGGGSGAERTGRDDARPGEAVPEEGAAREGAAPGGADREGADPGGADADPSPALTAVDEQTLRRYASDTWRSMAAMVDEDTGLVADHIGVTLDDPSTYTSPTDIAGYLWSTVVVRDFGIIPADESRVRLAAALDGLSRLE
jgi:hypothetical protein